jgi:hypothetical protein
MLTFWDIAVGILIAAFFIGAIYKGLTESHERALGIGAAVLAALMIIWRATCWHGDIKCDVSILDSVRAADAGHQ